MRGKENRRRQLYEEAIEAFPKKIEDCMGLQDHYGIRSPSVIYHDYTRGLGIILREWRDDERELHQWQIKHIGDRLRWADSATRAMCEPHVWRFNLSTVEYFQADLEKLENLFYECIADIAEERKSYKECYEVER